MSVEVLREPEPIALTLFVAAASPASSLALTNIHDALERLEHNPFVLEVVEVFQQPLRALQHRILVTPTLLAYAPVRRVVGDLGDPSLLDYFLHSASKTGPAPAT